MSTHPSQPLPPDSRSIGNMLALDCAAETNRIVAWIRRIISAFHRRGAVVAMSGGIDSSVVAALCVRALGPQRVLGLLLPEKDSERISADLATRVADGLGIETITEDITGMLEAAGCYRRRDDAIRLDVPQYAAGYLCKLIGPNVVEGASYRLFSLVVQPPQGEAYTVRLSSEAYLGLVAAVNFKQRTRKMIEYYHADRLHYAVTGTPNRLEYDQGFFVKNGDGSADFKPIAHLYKTQVYQMARYLGLPPDVCARPPTTDTFSLQQSQDEFFFPVPYDKMDACLYGLNRGFSAAHVAAAAGMEEIAVRRVFADIEAKRKATRYLHASALLVESIPEVQAFPQASL